MRPMWRRWLGVAVVLPLLMSGCTGTAGAPSDSGTASVTLRPVIPTESSPVPAARPTLRQRVLAVVIEDHLGPGSAAFGSARGNDTSVYLPATAASSARTVSVESRPKPRYDGCPPPEAPVECLEREDGVRLEWTPDRAVVSVPRGARLVVASLTGVRLPRAIDDNAWPAAVRRLTSLATDRRVVAEPSVGLLAEARAFPRWRADPACARAVPTGPAPVPPATGGPAEPTTPQALAALVAQRVAGTCAYADRRPDGSSVRGTVYLTADDGEYVSATVTTDPGVMSCDGFGECEEGDGVTVAWLLDVPEEYPLRVRLSRPVEGGYLVVEHASRQADPDRRAFPVPLDTLLALVRDERAGFAVDPSLIRAGDELPLCWRLLTPTDD